MSKTPKWFEDLEWRGEGVVHVYDAEKLKWAIDSDKARIYSDDRTLTGKMKQKFSRVKHDGVWVPKDELDRIGIKPDAEMYAGSNLICTAGVTRIWNLLTNQGATQAADATHTRVGVGNGTTAASAADTDFSAAAGSTNRFFNMVDATSTVSTNTNKWTSTFATGNGNFVWAEWGVDVGNTSTGTTVAALLLNHAVPNSLGTKTSAAAWAFSCTLSIS